MLKKIETKTYFFSQNYEGTDLNSKYVFADQKIMPQY